MQEALLSSMPTAPRAEIMVGTSASAAEEEKASSSPTAIELVAHPSYDFSIFEGDGGSRGNTSGGGRVAEHYPTLPMAIVGSSFVDLRTTFTG